MELKWEYALPTSGTSQDYQYESPILVNKSFVYFVSQTTTGQKLHIIEKSSGAGCDHVLQQSVSVLPAKYFFLPYHDNAVIYTGDLHFVQSNTILHTLDFLGKGEVTSHLLSGKYLYVSCCDGESASLCCIDLDEMVFVWNLDISNSKRYRAGELAFFEGYLTCYGKDQLLLIQPENGEIIRTLKLPRIDKLFCPVMVDNDTMLIGYTNWTNAGVIKYRVSTKQIIWRQTRKFEGPQLKCRIYLHESKVFWVKNSTELIAVDVESGEEIYRLPTTPWLYTDLQFYRDGILYGTAGSDGYLNYLDIETGNHRWTAFLKNGCAYFDVWNDFVFVGDFDKTVKQFSIRDGVLIRQMQVDGEVVGQMAISDGALYTVIWGNSEKNVRLVQIQIV